MAVQTAIGHVLETVLVNIRLKAWNNSSFGQVTISFLKKSLQHEVSYLLYIYMYVCIKHEEKNMIMLYESMVMQFTNGALSMLVTCSTNSADM
jgi:hypothetical protein